jgi:aspartyl-tRNA(Asn)/glutamyl-tRNA(Gln) amidotransferase subunit B
MFCACGTQFGKPPNTLTCPVCIGMPGSLPVMNRKAFELALKTAVALNCEIPRFTKWDRKNYYYPDLPKGYQISQFDLPMSRNGWLAIDVEGEREKGEGENEKAEGGRQKAEETHQQPPTSNPQSPIPNPSTLSPHPNPLPKGEGTLIHPNALPKGEGTRIAKRIRILRAHLEEDAGKSMHDEVAGKADSRIDLNRTGTPLLEIVSQPDLRSPEEARAYLAGLKLLLNYLGVSDCNMQEGSLRVDANINLHIDRSEAGQGSGVRGQESEDSNPQSPTPNPQSPLSNPQPPIPNPSGIIATPIVEIKNMNSFRAVERALAYEAKRQWAEWQETGYRLGDVPKSTRGWDEASQTTRQQRTKEESSDYRYFPDPDLAPVTVAEEEVERIRASLGELPDALRYRLEQTFGITPYDAEVLVNQGRALVDYYLEAAAACGDGKAAANWIQQNVLRWLGERQADIGQYPVAAKSLAELIAKVRGGAFETSRGREVLGLMVSEGKSLAEAVEALGIEEVDDAAVLALCRKLVESNPKVVAEVKQGKLKGLGALIGQAKKENPNVNPSRVRDLCQELIGKLEL